MWLRSVSCHTVFASKNIIVEMCVFDTMVAVMKLYEFQLCGSLKNFWNRWLLVKGQVKFYSAQSTGTCTNLTDTSCCRNYCFCHSASFYIIVLTAVMQHLLTYSFIYIYISRWNRFKRGPLKARVCAFITNARKNGKVCYFDRMYIIRTFLSAHSTISKSRVCFDELHAYHILT